MIQTFKKIFSNLIIFQISVLFLFLSVKANGEDKSNSPTSKEVAACEVAKEFITIFEFLRSRIELVGNEKSALTVAKKAALSCQGSAVRFIRTVSIFNDIEIDNRSLIDLSVEVAGWPDDKAISFQEIFQKSYVASYLDLDLYESIRVAKKLAFLNEGESAKIGEDYKDFVVFCLEDKGLNFSKPQCGKLAENLISFRKSNRKPITPQIKDLYEFLILDMDKNKKPIADNVSFIKIAEKVLSKDEKSVDNFKASFKYANSDKGLKLTMKESLKFAIDLVTEAGVTTGFTPSR